jgi:hypothetical protein
LLGRPILAEASREIGDIPRIARVSLTLTAPRAD